MNRFAAVTFLCAASVTVSAQTHVLKVKSRIPTPVEFDDFRTFALPTACDDQGRSYVKLSIGKSGMVGPMLRLSAKGMLEAEFDTSGALLNVFAVRPNGGIAMVQVDNGAKSVINFGPDGKRESVVPLDRPPIPFFPNQIAVFRSGEILVAGVQYHPGYKASTAVYDPAGHLVKQFALGGDAEIEHAIELGDARYAQSPGQGNRYIGESVAITGDDGFVYLMRATSPATVYAISPAGEVVRKIVVSAPTEGGLPDFGLRVAKNRLAIRFFSGCDSFLKVGSCHGGAYVVVDATTGQRLASYEAGRELGNPLACYAPDPDRFFGYDISQGPHRLEIVEAAAK
jgi:hypothetical protein